MLYKYNIIYECKFNQLYYGTLDWIIPIQQVKRKLH